MKSLKDFLVIGEKNIFKELFEIISIALESNAILKEILKMNYDEKILLKYDQVKELEKKSDEISFKIGEDVTSGAISPNIIDSLLECIQKADDIVDLYYYISREMNRMSRTCSINFTVHQEAEWDLIYEKFFNLSEKALQKIERMLSTSDETEISKLRKEIETLEEEGDEVKDQGFDRLYGIASKLSFLQFYHYSEVLHKCDDILDSCEDISQLIVSIVTSILK